MQRTALLVLLGASVITTTAGAQQPSLVTLLDTYSQGQYDEAVQRAAAIEDLGPLRVRFVQDVPLWVRADPVLTEKRRAAAAAFLLELTRARLESDWGRLGDLIEFVCADLRGGQPDRAFERAWQRASVALAGRARARLWLLADCGGCTRSSIRGFARMSRGLRADFRGVHRPAARRSRAE